MLLSLAGILSTYLLLSSKSWNNQTLHSTILRQLMSICRRSVAVSRRSVLVARISRKKIPLSENQYWKISLGTSRDRYIYIYVYVRALSIHISVTVLGALVYVRHESKDMLNWSLK